MFITHKLYKTCSFVQVIVNDTRAIHQAKNIKSMQATECINKSCMLQRREREREREREGGGGGGWGGREEGRESESLNCCKEGFQHLGGV